MYMKVKMQKKERKDTLRFQPNQNIFSFAENLKNDDNWEKKINNLGQKW